MSVQSVVSFAGAAAVILTAAGLIAAVVSKAWRMAKRWGDFLDDWFGEPAYRGESGRPGVPERLSDIEGRMAYVEGQMRNNGGSTLRDKIDRINENTRSEEEAA
jgi:hypothetical protein